MSIRAASSGSVKATEAKGENVMSMNSAVTVLGSVAGAALTSVLQRRYGVTGVMASALVGLLGAAVGSLVPNADLPAAVFAGSFVGMTAVTVAPLGPIALAGAVAGVLCAIVKATNAFPAYGGKLDLAAFVASSSVSGGRREPQSRNTIGQRRLDLRKLSAP